LSSVGEAPAAGASCDTARRVETREAAQNPPGWSGWRNQLGFLSPSENRDSLGRIGPYEIASLIGRGGMGIVLKALDTALNRHVAIKVLAGEYAHSGAARRRFAREAKAAAAVVHDHVVPIYSINAEGDVPYLVMAWIPGRSLQERIDRLGPLDLREILRIGMQAAAGLAAAHKQGLVHRDIKPANILLEDSLERVRITDFGLARAIDDVSQTQSGILAGTPQYMSPEQAAGEAIDHRTDLFSLGSVLYAMCTGRSPFRAETTVAVIRRICDGSPRPVREVNPDVPDWLAEIIEKLHAKNPAERFQTAAEVAELLESRLADLQNPRLAPSTPPRAANSPTASRRRRVLFRGLLLVAGLVLLAGVTVFLYDIVRPAAEVGEARDSGSDATATEAAASAIGAGALASADSQPAGIGTVVESRTTFQSPIISEAPNGAASWSAQNDGRSIEGELNRLREALDELASALFPRELFFPSSSSALADEIEQRLEIIENEFEMPRDSRDSALSPPTPLPRGERGEVVGPRNGNVSGC
jgi:serine/threonine-protein kinase